MERLEELCVISLQDKELDQDDYLQRLKSELRQISYQGEEDYLLDLHDRFQEEELVFPKNEHNSLVDWLLGLAPDFDINQGFDFIQGEAPDIDMDYMSPVRSYLKREWAADKFGQEYICEVGTYGTAGIKSGILDIARRYSAPHDEIQAITVKMKDKYLDDEGNTQEMEWDDALELYPEFKTYCEKYPEIASAAKKLLQRNKSAGVHAGGLIISNQPIDGFVPLEVRMVNKENPNGVICSAWTEGLNRQDLGPVGLVKFDMLVIGNLLQLAIGCKLVKERHGLDKICAKEGMWDWSDTSYLNDPKSIEMANRADLKGIFQFDSEGIRKMVKRGGVDRFDDIAAYSALYRPSCLSLKMDVTYCKRKKGEEQYEIHPLLESALAKTYGVLLYQENIMDVLGIVGSIPSMQVEKVRKAISKKKKKEFEKSKDMFIENGKVNLNVSAEYVIDLWNQIEKFSAYGFNKCLQKGTLVYLSDGSKVAIETLVDVFNEGKDIFVHSLGKDHKFTKRKVLDAWCNGKKEVFEVVTRSGYRVTATGNHKFWTMNGYKQLSELKTGDFLATPRKLTVQGQKTFADHELVCLAGVLTEGNVCHPSTVYFYNNDMAMINDFASAAKQFDRTSIKLTRKESTGNYCVACNTSGIRRSEYENYNDFLYRRCGLFVWLKKLGMIGCRATTKFIPPEIFEATDEEICFLLGRMWCGDGFVTNGESHDPYYATSSITLAKDVRYLLLRLGIISTLHKKKFKYKGEIRIGYTVNIVGRESKDIFVDRIGKYCVSKQNEVEILRNYLNSTIPDSSIDVIPCDIVDLIKEENTFQTITALAINSGLCEGTFNSHSLKTKRGYRRDTIGKIARTLNSSKILDFAESDLFWDNIVSITPAGIEDTYNLEVEEDHNFIANGIVVGNSHATAYAFLSMQLLYLKSHYPIEFYTSIMMCEEKDDKLKDYKLDAAKHGIDIQPVHINKSKKNFSIQEEQVYFGFSNIKEIGDGVAEKIATNQPYENFEDFLYKFGADATVSKAMVSLGIFEGDRVNLRKFAEHCKGLKQKKHQARKRFDESMDRYYNELKELLLQEVKEDDPDFEKLFDFTVETQSLWEERFSGILRPVVRKHKGQEKICQVSYVKILQTLANKRNNRLEKFSQEETAKLTMDGFDSSQIELETEEMEILTTELEVDGKKSFPLAERKYYGFQWTHRLETCPSYTGATIDKFLEQAENGLVSGMIEVEILKVEKRVSKGAKKTEFYTLTVEDGNGKQMKVNVWMIDYLRFEGEMKEKTLVKMRVTPPNGGFSTMTFQSYPRQMQRAIPPKEEDARLIVIKEKG